MDRGAPSGALERFLANRRPGVIPLLIVLLRALCACRWGSDATGEEAGEAGAATRRAPLGPRLTCALYRVVFMRLPAARCVASGMTALERACHEK